MSTERQKTAARKNIKKARAAGRGRASSRTARSARSGPLSTARRNDLPDSKFAFPKQRKEPLIDAGHVRSAVARFDQVEGVTNDDRDRAWKRIRAAARKYDVEISERGWRQLMPKKSRTGR